MLLLQVYEPEWSDDAPARRMDRSVNRLVGTVCSPDDRNLAGDYENVEFLGNLTE